MSQPTSQIMIEAREVEKWYPNGFQALRGASLQVRRGEVVVIMGPSGRSEEHTSELQSQFRIRMPSSA